MLVAFNYMLIMFRSNISSKQAANNTLWQLGIVARTA